MKSRHGRILSVLASTVLLFLGSAATALLPPGGRFVDDNGSVHEPDIEAIAAEGITRGCNQLADRFCPDASVSREQMAAFLSRALQLPPASTDAFRDDNGSVFQADINSLAQAGITKGCNPPANDGFCPTRSITRGEMAAMLVRAFHLPASDQNLFTDDDDSVFETEIDRLGTAGITKGCAPNRFCPTAFVTRAQMASFLRRALGLTPIVPPPPISTTTPNPSSRNPVLWPYPYNSIWNHPLGDSADLVPFGLDIPTQQTLNIEEDIIITSPNAALRQIKESNAGWTGARRCDPATWTGLNLKDSFPVPIPSGWLTDPGYWGDKPNHSAAILLPDMTLFETQPFHICPDGTAVSRHHNVTWRGDSILTGGHGDPRGGSHGGSGMTAFGGTIRLGEWVRGGEIRHALKILVDSSANLSPTLGGHRWPALNADVGYANEYGGSVPAARMGSLVALPPSFNVDGLNSEPARILARALQRYGAYIVDNTGWSVVSFSTQWGPAGRVKDEFRSVWGFPLHGHRPNTSGAQAQFLTDLETIYANLHVVNDNGPNNIGGAGARMAPWAPPFTNGTGGPPG
jgi:hypothetical protein